MIVERILAQRTPVDLQAAPLAAAVSHHAIPEVVAAPVVGTLFIEAAGVVYDDTCWWRWLVQVLTHTGIHTRYEALLEHWETEYLQQPKDSGQDFWKALRRCLSRMGLTAGCCDEVQAAASALHKQWEASLHPFPEVDRTLAELALRGVQLVAVANTGSSRERLAERLRSMSLAGHFRRLLSAQDCDRSLADPAFYGPTLAGLQLEPQEVAMLSNKAWHLAAARQAGLTTVAVNCPTDSRADICLDRLATLVCKLRYRSSRPVAA